MADSRVKGHTFERHMVKVLRAIWPNISTARLKDKDADNRGVDLVNTGEYAIQCKRYARNYPNLEETLDLMDTPDRKIVVHKRDKKDILVTMKLGTFLSMVEEQKDPIRGSYTIHLEDLFKILKKQK